MNYTELNEDQKAVVRIVILLDDENIRCGFRSIKDADYPEDIDVEELPKKFPAKYIQELFRESNLNDDYGPIPEDLVIDNWDKFMIDHWTDFPNGYWYEVVGCL